jgi:NADPH:quinone reductase-like Zn-dependent oxidoreductase
MLQVARAAGVIAIAIASASNHELCTSLGAVEVLDYHKPSIVDDVVRAVRIAGGYFVGVLDTISNPDKSLKYCILVLEQLGGGQLGILDPLLQPKVSENIKVTNILGFNNITHTYWKDFVTPALEQGKLKCSPEPLVVGQGLESLQKALDVQRKGVSAKKVVVTL